MNTVVLFIFLHLFVLHLSNGDPDPDTHIYLHPATDQEQKKGANPNSGGEKIPGKEKGAAPKSGGGFLGKQGATLPTRALGGGPTTPTSGLNNGLDYRSGTGNVGGRFRNSRLDNGLDYRSGKGNAGAGFKIVRKIFRDPGMDYRFGGGFRNPGLDYNGKKGATPAPQGPTEAPDKDEIYGMVNCGGHWAYSCGGCPSGQGATWCNGDCFWTNGVCQSIAYPANSVNCGSHKAASCAVCPQGRGAAWCNGDCYWSGGCRNRYPYYGR